MADVIIKDNSKKLLQNLDSVQDVILEALGLQATGYAQLKAPVDTGLLRNSLTYAIAGSEPKKQTYKADKADESGNIREGRYQGSTTKKNNEKAVYIGTNVEYGPYQELGGSKTKHTPYLKPAMVEHKEEYKKIVIAGLKGELT